MNRLQLREWLATGVLVTALVVAYAVLPMRGTWWPLAAIAGPLAALGSIPLTVRHTRRILVSGHPVIAVTHAIIVMVTLLVLGFASTYYAMDAHAPDQMDGLATKIDSVYFTVTTLATVGFGDIHPAGQVARLVATLNMVANVAVLGVAVRLVTWAGRQRLQRPQDQSSRSS